MALKDIVGKGKQMVEERGGVDGLKEHATELKEIAKREGSVGDKLKDAAGVVKDAAKSEPEGPFHTREAKSSAAGVFVEGEEGSGNSARQE